MSTVNISLPAKQLNFIDRLVKFYGFANRSEFVRSLIRLISSQPELVQKAATFPFITPREKSIKKIIVGFAKTKKYSNNFLRDFEEGLKTSSYFKT